MTTLYLDIETIPTDWQEAIDYIKGNVLVYRNGEVAEV